MNEQLDRILDAALALTDEDQLRLLDALGAALDERGLRPFDDSWLGEIRRRSAEFDSGSVKSIPWAEVKARARRRLESRG